MKQVRHEKDLKLIQVVEVTVVALCVCGVGGRAGGRSLEGVQKSSGDGLGASYLGVYSGKIHQAVNIYDVHTFFT